MKVAATVHPDSTSDLRRDSCGGGTCGLVMLLQSVKILFCL